jgi:hypothetical protein
MLAFYNRPNWLSWGKARFVVSERKSQIGNYQDVGKMNTAWTQ